MHSRQWKFACDQTCLNCSWHRPTTCWCRRIRWERGSNSCPSFPKPCLKFTQNFRQLGFIHKNEKSSTTEMKFHRIDLLRRQFSSPNNFPSKRIVWQKIIQETVEFTEEITDSNLVLLKYTIYSCRIVGFTIMLLILFWYQQLKFILFSSNLQIHFEERRQASFWVLVRMTQSTKAFLKYTTKLWQTGQYADARLKLDCGAIVSAHKFVLGR